MATNRQVQKPSPRLNPFAFPSDTTCRFALLIVFVAVTSSYIYIGLSFAFPSELKRDEESIRACLQEADQKLDPADLNPFVQALTGYLQPLASRLISWAIAGIAVVLGLATVIYWIYPTWKIQKDKLEPLKAEEVPDVANDLAELCRGAGLSRHPVFLWNPLHCAVGGLAFGRIGYYCIALSGGLVLLFYTDRAAFRAILRHELAHLRNQDINKTYFAVAVWWAFVVAALLPYVVSFYWRDNLAEILVRIVFI